MRSLSAVDSSMSENMIANLPFGDSRARSGRSTSAQSASSSIEDRTAAPNPSRRRMLAVCHTVLTAFVPPDTSIWRVSRRRRNSSASAPRRSSAVAHSTTRAMASPAAISASTSRGDLHSRHRSSIGCWWRDDHQGPWLREPVRARQRRRRAPALWLRETLLLPTSGDAGADVWVMVFDPDGHRALRQHYPIDRADFGDDPWTARIADTSLEDSARPRRTARPGALGPDDQPGRSGPGASALGARLPVATADRQDDGPAPSGDLRRSPGARRCRRRRSTAGRAASTTTGAPGTPRRTPTVRSARSTTRPTRRWRSSRPAPRSAACCSPASRCSSLRHAGREFAVRTIRGSLQTHGHYRPFRWTFGARLGEQMIEGEITTVPADVIGLTYPDTHGGSEVLLQLRARLVPNPVGGQRLRQDRAQKCAGDVRDPHRRPDRRRAAAGLSRGHQPSVSTRSRVST